MTHVNSCQIQIQHLLKLNVLQNYLKINSIHSNTTLVKVKWKRKKTLWSNYSTIQIQHLLKLNARKINLYDFHYTIKSIEIQGF